MIQNVFSGDRELILKHREDEMLDA